MKELLEWSEIERTKASSNVMNEKKIPVTFLFSHFVMGGEIEK